MPSYRYPEELPCYHLAREFRTQIAQFCRHLPREEEYRLKDQMLRAARSVTANIAEGFGRHHHQENIQFCRQARGSLTEMRDHLHTALDEGFSSESDTQSLFQSLEKVHESLNGYIAYLRRIAQQ
jgi:four helix bundle protein